MRTLHTLDDRTAARRRRSSTSSTGRRRPWRVSRGARGVRRARRRARPPTTCGAIVRRVPSAAGDPRHDVDRDAAAAGLNALLAAFAGPPRLVRHEGWDWHLHVDRADDAPWAEWLAASAALALATRLVGRRRRAVGRVRRRGARGAFVHDGRGGDRRCCSTTCASRERVRRHRAAGTGPIGPVRRTGGVSRRSAGPASTRRCQRDGVRATPAARPRTSSGRSCAGPTRRRGRAMRDRAAGARGRGRAPAEARRHPVVGDEVVADRRLVAGAATAGSSAPPARIASAARRPVSSAWPMPSPVITSVAIAASPVEQHAAVGQRRRVDAGRDRPRRVAALERGSRAERGADVRAVEQAGPHAPSCPGCAGCRRAARRSRRWPARRAAGTTRRSRAAGRRRTTRRGRSAAGPSTSRDVLAEGVPLAEVARLGRARAPCAPGSTCRRRRRRSGRAIGAVAVDADDDVVAVLVERAVEAVALRARWRRP